MFSKAKLAVSVLLIIGRVRGELPPSGEAMTITQVPDFQNSRACVQKCVYLGPYGNGRGGAGYPDAPQVVLGCSINSCLCRPDLQPTALSVLSQCLGNCDNILDSSSG